MKIKHILLLTAMLGFTIASSAQSKDKKWGLGLNFGSEQYKGELGNGLYDLDQAFNGFGGITVSRYLTPHLDVTLQSTFGELTHRNSNGADYNFSYNMFQFNLNLKYSFFKYETAKLRPFVFAGLGHMIFTDKESDDVINNTQLPDFGLGLSFKVSPTINIVLQETFIYSDSDFLDNRTKVRKNHNDWLAQHSIGVVFNLGKKKDSDKDGVPNRKDKCPDVAGLELFDGCPDTDGDGVPDTEDQCPNDRGLAIFNGCPDTDTDTDGIPDKDDKCPNKKGTQALNGCPDRDGDGIADKDDRCPNDKGSLNLSGCPDDDGDGVANIDDECPDVTGTLNGCPDTDGDGIADKDDKCPNVAGVAENKGCPEIKVSEIKALEKAIEGIKFKTSKAIITSASYPILNNVASILKANEAYKLRIEGHSDSQGNDDLNLLLSEQRAKAVKDYFENSGINSSRLSSTGFGEIKPIADNSTAAGRAKNRRVELTIEF